MPAHPRHTPETWAAVRAEVEAGDTIPAAAARHGLHPASVYERAGKEKWYRRKHVPTPPPPRESTHPQNPKPEARSKPEARTPKPEEPREAVTSRRSRPNLPRLIPWAPGRSGNPAGVPRTAVEAKRLCQRLVPDAVLRAHQMMMCDDPQVAAVGTKFILDHGMPKKDPPPVKAPPPLDFSTMTLEQMDALDVALTALAEAQRLEEVRRRDLGLPAEAEEPLEGEVMAPEEPPADVPPLRDDGVPPVIEAECVDLDLTAW